jgi:hypothetical protein
VGLPADGKASDEATQGGSAALTFRAFWRLGEHRGLLQGFLGLFESLGGVLHGAFGLLVAGKVVLLAVPSGRGAMGVRGPLVHFCCSDVIIRSHDGLL